MTLTMVTTKKTGSEVTGCSRMSSREDLSQQQQQQQEVSTPFQIQLIQHLVVVFLLCVWFCLSRNPVGLRALIVVVTY
jgi:hypothetical protein